MGLRCEHCGKTLEYRERVVSLDQGTATFLTKGVDTIGANR
jgi:hypothetical protein